jgi:hypothetical protein
MAVEAGLAATALYDVDVWGAGKWLETASFTMFLFFSSFSGFAGASLILRTTC